MPASKTVDISRGDGLLVDIEPVDQEPTVYFTDESLEFQLTIRNTTDFNYVEGSSIWWVLAIGSGMPSPVYYELIEIEVPAHKERKYTIGGELLAFEGHGVVGISAGTITGRGDPDYKISKGRTQDYDPVYTFSVWDRSQYQALYEKPKKLQKVSIYLSIAIAVFAIIQIALVLL